MPEVAVAVAGVLMLIGGFCVLTGFQPYVGLSCIALFLMYVTPTMQPWPYGLDLGRRVRV